MTDHSLTLGSLLLTNSVADEDHDFTFDVLADGATFGVAQGVQEVVRSLLADGDLYRITRYGNREVSFRVQIEGPSLGSLAHGEAALRAEVGRPNLLTWQPPDALSVPTVFEVVASEMAQTFDDLDELKRRRVFVVTLTCGPFARSADMVTVEALVSGTSTVVVDTCDSTTGWAVADGSPDTLSTSAGAVWATDSAGGNDQMSLRRAASIDVSAHPYFKLEWKANPGSGYMILGISAAANPFPSELRRVALGDGWFRSTWLVEPGDLDSGFQLSYVNTSPSTTDYLAIREVSKSDVAPGTTPRQQTRIIVVGGTERTPASIHVQPENGTDPLEQIIVHTCPEDGSGYSPPLRRWRTADSSGTEVDSPITLSGKYESIVSGAGGFYAEVPTSALPEGGYALMARIAVTNVAGGDVTIFWSTSTIFPDATTQQGYVNGSITHSFSADGYEMVPIDVLSLPSVRTMAGKVQIVLQVVSHPDDVVLDEAWLFRVDDDCALTIVETERPHLWLDSAGVSSPVPTVWVGDGEETTVHPSEGLKQMGAHVLSPEGTAAFTAALTDNPLTDATFYRRWHSNAAS
jgi:hypothetical protein